MGAADGAVDELALEGNDVVALEANETVVQPLKFKVVSHGFSAITTLDVNWQGKPFMSAVVKPVVLKLNKRPNKEPVSAAFLERVEIDGVEASGIDLATATAAGVVPASAVQVELFFGLAPPSSLRFSVQAAGNEVSFTITLDSKFMRKSFYDAVLVPFVHYYNKRVHLPVEAAQCVQVHIDGQKAPGATGTEVRRKTAYQFLGRTPASVVLFFSWDSVAQFEKGRVGRDGGWSRLQFKVPISKATDVQNEKELDFSHSELTSADGVDLGKRLVEYGPLAKLKHFYLEHNTLGDMGAAAVARALNRQNTPALKRLMLRHNRIGSAGLLGLAAAWGLAVEAEAEATANVPAEDTGPRRESKSDDLRCSPGLDILSLEDNVIQDKGVLALGAAIEAGGLTVAHIRLHGNAAITPAMREHLLRPEVRRQGIGTLFHFEAVDTGSCFDQEGRVLS